MLNKFLSFSLSAVLLLSSLTPGFESGSFNELSGGIIRNEYRNEYFGVLISMPAGGYENKLEYTKEYSAVSGFEELDEYLEENGSYPLLDYSYKIGDSERYVLLEVYSGADYASSEELAESIYSNSADYFSDSLGYSLAKACQDCIYLSSYEFPGYSISGSYRNEDFSVSGLIIRSGSYLLDCRVAVYGSKYSYSALTQTLEYTASPILNAIEEDVSAWEDVKAVVCKSSFALGLNSKGEVLEAGQVPGWMDFSGWSGVKKLLVNEQGAVVGLKEDGGVLLCLEQEDEELSKELLSWTELKDLRTDDESYPFQFEGIKENGEYLEYVYPGMEWNSVSVCGLERISIAQPASTLIYAVDYEGKLLVGGDAAEYCSDGSFEMRQLETGSKKISDICADFYSAVLLFEDGTVSACEIGEFLFEELPGFEEVSGIASSNGALLAWTYSGEIIPDETLSCCIDFSCFEGIASADLYYVFSDYYSGSARGNTKRDAVCYAVGITEEGNALFSGGFSSSSLDY